MRLFSVLFLSCLVGLLPVASMADNPDGASLRVKLSGSETASRIGTNIRVRAVHIFSEVLEEGTSCDVILSACAQKFIPAKVQSSRGGRCDAVEIATVSMTAGQQKATFRTVGPPLAVKRAGRARQISFQTKSDCIDVGSAEDTLYSLPRARKSSRIDRLGRSAQIVFSRFARRIRTIVE